MNTDPLESTSPALAPENVSAPNGAGADHSRRVVGYGLTLVAAVAILSVLHWSWYPMFIDTYYHMAVIQGMDQAGGLPAWAFWEMAPGGRVHIYPPAIHIIGYLLTFVGLSPAAFITLLSGTLYPACLFTTWLWLRKVFGPRTALAAVILLCGPAAFFWNQATFTANAFSMTFAPLALLALESEHFLACGVLNLLASTAHPMGLFLPPALAINTWLRRKKVWPGLLAACLPMALYAPWLGHIWANRAYLPEQRTGSDVSLMGIGVGSGLNLGIFITLAALAGIFWIVKKRREGLGLLGPALGFAVVLPMGFGGRFFQFNVHWPMACLGGYGIGMLIEWLEQRMPRWENAIRVASVSLAFAALTTWAAIEIPMPKKFGGLPGGPGGPGMNRNEGREQMRAGGPISPMGPMGNAAPGSSRFSGGPSELVQLLDPSSRPAPFGGGGPGGMPGGPGMQGRPNFPGGFPGPGGMPFPGDPFMGGAPEQGNTSRGELGGRGMRGMRGGGGPGGMDMIHQEGAQEFFAQVKKLVGANDVICIQDGPAGSLLTGATGRWTSGGILRDVQSAEGRVRPADCQFQAILNVAGPGPGGMDRGGNQTQGFTKVFENAFGALWKNNTKVASKAPAQAAVATWSLVLLALIGLAALGVDLYWPKNQVRWRQGAALGAFVLAALCLAPLTVTAIGELLHPPKVEARRNGLEPFGGPPRFQERDAAPSPTTASKPAEPIKLPPPMQKHLEAVQALAAKNANQGGEPIWSAVDTLKLRRLVEDGKLDEAKELLDKAAARAK